MKFELDEIRKELINNTIAKFLINKRINFEDLTTLSIDIEDLDLENTSSNIDELSDLIDELERIVFSNNKNTGTVYTKKYISDFITQNLCGLSKHSRILDPGCGGGVFLLSAAELLHEKFNLKYSEIMRYNIFGLDIDPNCVMISKIILELLCLMNNEETKNISFNIFNANTLDSDWSDVLGYNEFDYIIGNPPYYNTHDMDNNEIEFLKNKYITCKNGVFNIFYAFIEESFSHLRDHSNSTLSFIVPNNFFTISAAKNLRSYISDHKLESIIDFTDNMVFKPVRTYNCIISLSHNNTDLKYTKIEKTSDLAKIIFNKKLMESKTISISLDKLNSDPWKLVKPKVLINLEKIENQIFRLKPFIRTGIATLKDEIYFVSKEGNKYFKEFEGKKYQIDPSIVRKIYKIPDLKYSDNISDSVRYIIFPYREDQNEMKIIPEDILKESFKLTYEYLKSVKHILDKRDKGKPNAVAWYAYGRSQGINNQGQKLLFPTFSNIPKFQLDVDKESLLSNGYAIYETDFIDLITLSKIINSEIMDYYVKNTSYSIEGGYFCYQKKYIENFSIPFLDENEIATINDLDGDELNTYLKNMYGIKI